MSIFDKVLGIKKDNSVFPKVTPSSKTPASSTYGYYYELGTGKVYTKPETAPASELKPVKEPITYKGKGGGFSTITPTPTIEPTGKTNMQVVIPPEKQISAPLNQGGVKEVKPIKFNQVQYDRMVLEQTKKNLGVLAPLSYITPAGLRTTSQDVAKTYSHLGALGLKEEEHLLFKAPLYNIRKIAFSEQVRPLTEEVIAENLLFGAFAPVMGVGAVAKAKKVKAELVTKNPQKITKLELTPEDKVIFRSKILTDSQLRRDFAKKLFELPKSQQKQATKWLEDLLGKEQTKTLLKDVAEQEFLGGTPVYVQKGGIVELTPPKPKIDISLTAPKLKQLPIKKTFFALDFLNVQQSKKKNVSAINHDSKQVNDLLFSAPKSHQTNKASEKLANNLIFGKASKSEQLFNQPPKTRLTTAESLIFGKPIKTKAGGGFGGLFFPFGFGSKKSDNDFLINGKRSYRYSPSFRQAVFGKPKQISAKELESFGKIKFTGFEERPIYRIGSARKKHNKRSRIDKMIFGDKLRFGKFKI